MSFGKSCARVAENYRNLSVAMDAYDNQLADDKCVEVARDRLASSIDDALMELYDFVDDRLLRRNGL